jgi:hypothetical protein
LAVLRLSTDRQVYNGAATPPHGYSAAIITLQKGRQMSKEKIHAAPKNQETAREEVSKPKNIRANAMPTDGFVLSVDAKFKARFESPEEAMAAGVKLKQNYPVIQVAIYDAAAQLYTPVHLPGDDA